MKNAVIFGGSGFIGIFAKYLIEKEHFNKIFILDLEAPINKNNTYRSQIFTENQNRITYVKCDVRDQINWIPKEKIDLIAISQQFIESLATIIMNIMIQISKVQKMYVTGLVI